jgi:hypothetical protein
MNKDPKQTVKSGRVAARSARLRCASLTSTVVAGALLVACGGTSGEGSGAGDESVAPASTEELTICNLPETVYPITVEVTAKDDLVRVAITNSNQKEAALELDAVAISSHGREEHSGLRAVHVPAGETTTLELSRSELTTTSAEDTDVSLTVSVKGMVDGEPSGQYAGELALKSRVNSRLHDVRMVEVPYAAGGQVLTQRVLEESGIAYGDALPEPEGTEGGIKTFANVSKKLCFKANLTLQNVGIGEDFWTAASSVIPAKGQYFWGRPVTTPASSWVALQTDQSGCITQSFKTGSWEFQATGYGQYTSGSNLRVIVLSDASTGASFATNFTGSITSSTSTQNITYTASADMTPYHIVHASLLANLAALTSASFVSDITVKVNATATDSTPNNINVTAGDRQNKWNVSHELGHVVGRRETGDAPLTGYTLNYAANYGACSDAVHNSGSREDNSVAHIEGFASFYAATVWNDENQESSCMVRFAGPTAQTNINCSGSSTGYPLRVMENNCASMTAFTGGGNETDWMRVFWHLVDFQDALIPPRQATMKEVIDMIKRGSGWSATNHFTKLEAASNHANTPQYLEDRWDAFKAGHGIDW